MLSRRCESQKVRCRLIGCVDGGARFDERRLAGDRDDPAGAGSKADAPAGTAAEIVRVTTTERPLDALDRADARSADRVRRETVRRVWLRMACGPGGSRP